MEWIDNKIGEAFQREGESFLHTIYELDQACWNDMMYLPKPDGWEIDQGWIGKAARELFGTQGLGNKKDALQNIRRKYEDKIKNVFDNFAKNLQHTINTILIGAFPDCQAISLPDVSEIHSVLGSLIYVNWDIQDDIFFRNKYVSNDTINNRSREKIEAILEKLNIWWQSLEKQIVERIQATLHKRYGEQIQTYSEMTEFVKNMLDIYQYIQSRIEKEE